MLNTVDEIELSYFKGLNENGINDFNSEFFSYKEQARNNYTRLKDDNRFAFQNGNEYTSNYSKNKYLGSKRH